MIPLIERANKILIVASANQSTGDAICGVLALQIMLTRQGKKVTSVAQDSVPEKFHFLSGAKLVRNDLGENGDFVISLSTDNAEIDRIKYQIHERNVDIIVSPKKGKFSPEDVNFKKSTGDFDLIITVGANNLEELGAIFAENTEVFASLPIINISNSIDNEFFGKMNLVDLSTSSNCEILFDLFLQDEESKKSIDADVATILLAGIISETDSFREKTATAHSFEIASQLQIMGAMQPDIIENLFKKQSLTTLKVWGRILGNLDIDKNHKIAWSRLTRADFEIAQANSKQIGNFTSDLLRHAKESDLAVLFIEKDEDVEIQIRTNQPNVDLQKLNSYLGAVGHKNKFGLNFLIMHKSISEIETDFMRLLVNFQKERLQIPAEVKVEKIKLIPQKIDDSKDLFPRNTGTSIKEEIVPIAPEHIPFEAPFQPHENAGKIKEVLTPKPPAEKIETTPDIIFDEEISDEKAKTALPDWLKEK